MKVLVSHRRSVFPSGLNFCLVLACSLLIFFVSLGCGARIVAQDSSAITVEEVHEPILSEVSHQVSKEAAKGHVNDEKKVRRVTENLGKSLIEHEDVAGVKDEITSSHTDPVKKQINLHEKQRAEEEREGKYKRLIKRLKRSSDKIHGEHVDAAQSAAAVVAESVQQEETKSVIHDHNVEQAKKHEIEGIRRLDVNVEDEDKKEIHQVSEAAVKTSIPDAVSNVPEAVKHTAPVESHIEPKAGPVVSGISIADSVKSHNSKVQNVAWKTADKHETKHHNIPKSDSVISEIHSDSGDSNTKIASHHLRLQTLKNQALELQKEIRNKTLLQNLKEQKSEVLPDGLNLTEQQYLDALNKINSHAVVSHNLNSDSSLFKDKGLSETQLNIINKAQLLVPSRQRQVFYEDLSECIMGWDVYHCLKIFIDPLIIENEPQLVIEVHQRSKSKRQLLTHSNSPMDPEAVIFDILMEGLMKNPPNENVVSLIAAKNETLSKLLTCNKLQLLQMTEKYLPAAEREQYSEEMVSCVRRFEYFSCLKYFAWPMIQKYYPALPQFPLSDNFMTSLMYPNYPLITFPGYENGPNKLPEVVDIGPRARPEATIMEILRKTYNEQLRIPTLPTPLPWDWRTPSLTQEQVATIHLAEQLLPLNLRAIYVTKTMQCIKTFDYYNCMKYSTWPALRQFNPTIPSFPSFQEILAALGIPEVPSIQDFFNIIGQAFQIPEFQFPQIPFIPDFSGLFPGGAKPTPKPPASSDPASGASNNDNQNKTVAVLELKIQKILKDVRDSMGATPLSPATYTNRKVFLFPLMTEEQSKIFALAESILPPMVREPLITGTYFCLNQQNSFSNCARVVMWPFIRNHVKGLPDFPSEGTEGKIGIDMPAINADNFLAMAEIEKFFIEGREDAMGYIVQTMMKSAPEPINMQKVLEMLKAIQLKKPEFLNAQPLSFPRLPEFSSILTESQENIVQGVEKILPQEMKAKFHQDMLECSKNNKFPTCSRDVIFAAIYPCFQKALLGPYYNTLPTPDNLSAVRINVDINIVTEKQGDNTVITTDRRVVPIYPAHPETIIFAMLRKVQLTSNSLPEFPRESIAYAPEFKQAFSKRQAHLLTVAEGLLPEELRKNFLAEMFKCNQRDSFLNCTRDIMFPLMAKAYPDFPDFPDFAHDLDRSNMQSIVENLQNKQHDQQPDTLPRSYKPKRTLPAMDVLYKYMSEQRADKLKMLIDKLPDSLYYDLFVKMAQCSEFSDAISCTRDIVYPAMKYYYNKLNIDDYFPPTFLVLNPGSPGLQYELVCDNMEINCYLVPIVPIPNNPWSISKPVSTEPAVDAPKYIPFGRLSDGGRIFKRFEDNWNSNTPSVGER